MSSIVRVFRSYLVVARFDYFGLVMPSISSEKYSREFKFIVVAPFSACCSWFLIL